MPLGWRAVHLFVAMSYAYRSLKRLSLSLPPNTNNFTLPLSLVYAVHECRKRAGGALPSGISVCHFMVLGEKTCKSLRGFSGPALPPKTYIFISLLLLPDVTGVAVWKIRAMGDIPLTCGCDHCKQKPNNIQSKRRTSRVNKQIVALHTCFVLFKRVSESEQKGQQNSTVPPKCPSSRAECRSCECDCYHHRSHQTQLFASRRCCYYCCCCCYSRNMKCGPICALSRFCLSFDLLLDSMHSYHYYCHCCYSLLCWLQSAKKKTDSQGRRAEKEGRRREERRGGEGGKKDRRSKEEKKKKFQTLSRRCGQELVIFDAVNESSLVAVFHCVHAKKNENVFFWLVILSLT